MLLHKELTDDILELFYEVYNELGFGFLEKVYQNALYLELKNSGHKKEPQFVRKVFANDRKNLPPQLKA